MVLEYLLTVQRFICFLVLFLFFSVFLTSVEEIRVQRVLSQLVLSPSFLCVQRPGATLTC